MFVLNRRSVCHLKPLSIIAILFISGFTVLRYSSFNRVTDLPADSTFCPLVSPLLIGWRNTSIIVPQLVKITDRQFELEMRQNGLESGGNYQPNKCQSKHKVAIVVPYRNREQHLSIFLRYIHPFLQRQQINYTLIIVEQSEGQPFNRGLLSNIGFNEAVTQLANNYQCVIVHDVDFLPEDDNNPYTCPPQGKPRHMAFLVDIYDYQLMPLGYFGAVFAISIGDFRLVNGFSNAYWGWGKEDEDLFWRLIDANLTVTRTFQEQPFLMDRTRYTMLGHEPDTPNPNRQKLFKEATRRVQKDGLKQLKYRRLKLEFKPLFTHILVEVDPSNYE